MDNLEKHNTALLKVKLPPELKEYILKQASSEGTDMSKLMRKIISDYRKKNKRSKK